MSDSWRRGVIRQMALNAALALALALFFTLIGPFGSYSEPFPRRLAECLAYSTSLIVWGPLYPVLLRAAARRGAPVLLAAVLAAVAVALPITGFVKLIALAISPTGSPSLLRLYGAVVSVAVPIALTVRGIRWWSERARPPAPRSALDPRLLARLPAAVGREVLALQAEDHYVRVHTARGSTLLLMRLADAIDELDGQAGLQVHRSWWVARSAVNGAAPAGRRASLTLANGLCVPVARSAVPQARALGLLGVRA